MTWFVTRKPDNSIACLHRDHMSGYNDEQLADNDPEVIAFLTPPAPTLAQLLSPSDLDMARICEDLIVTLIPLVPALKAALPPVVLTKINARRAIRGQVAI